MIALVIILTVFLLTLEFAAKSTYGSFLSNEEVSDYINQFDYFEANPYSATLISGGNENETTYEILERLNDRSFISVTALPLYSKYYINGKGRVLRFSSAHKQIDNLYKNLKQ